MKDIFRRYGGSFQGADAGNPHLNLIGAALLVIGCGATLFTQNLAYLFAGFFSLFFLSALGLLIPGSSTSGIKKELQKEYLQKALSHANSGDKEKARDLIRKAQRHGDIPDEYKEFVEGF